MFASICIYIYMYTEEINGHDQFPGKYTRGGRQGERERERASERERGTNLDRIEVSRSAKGANQTVINLVFLSSSGKVVAPVRLKSLKSVAQEVRAPLRDESLALNVETL